jgi:hypothetical protein
MSTPRDRVNNNPLNIRPGSPYEGLATPSVLSGFCNFTSAVWGFRAAFRNYIAKADRGVNTIRTLITEWAPPGDNNNTADYIASVCKHTGYGPDEVINLKSWPVASAVCYAQVMVESGDTFEANWKAEDMANGAYRAGIVDAPPPVTRRVLQKVSGVGATLATSAGAAEPIVSGWAGSTHSPNLQMGFLILAGVLALIAALVRK